MIQHFASFLDITRRVRAERRTQRLIEGMARSLNGTLTIEGNRRTRIAVRFPAAVRSSINFSRVRLVSKEPFQSSQVMFTSVRAASTLPEKGDLQSRTGSRPLTLRRSC